MLRNRLSSVSHGFGFDPYQTPAEVRAELQGHLQEEPEFARTKLAKPPRRKRDLVGGLRWAAATYGWSTRVFGEIIDTLQAAGVLYVDEAEWMRIVGPTALQEKLASEWRKRVRAEQRRRRGKSLVSDEPATGRSAREGTPLQGRPRNRRRMPREQLPA